MDHEIIIELPDADRREGNQKILELKNGIHESALRRGVNESIDLEIKKTDKTAMDFGATLIIALGTPAALAIAKGVHDFISKYGDRVIMKVNGDIVFTGNAVNNIDQAALVAALAKVRGAKE